MKQIFKELLNEDEPFIFISLLSGLVAWLLVGLPFLGFLRHNAICVVLSFILAALGAASGVVSLFKCKFNGPAWFVFWLSGSLFALLFLALAAANSHLRDLH